MDVLIIGSLGEPYQQPNGQMYLDDRVGPLHPLLDLLRRFLNASNFDGDCELMQRGDFLLVSEIRSGLKARG